MGNEINPNKFQSSKLLITIKVAFVGIIFAVLLTVGISLLVLSRPTYSEEEKRELETMPKFSFSSLWKGSYTQKLQLFYNDTIPHREKFKHFADRIMSYKGIAPDDLYIYIPDDIPDYSDDRIPEVPTNPMAAPPESTSTPMEDNITASSGVSTPTPAPGTPKPNVNEFYQNAGIVTYKKRAMELYGGSKNNMVTYAAALDKLQQNMPDANIWSMSIPIASAYYLPASLAHKSGNQEADCNYIRNLLHNRIRYLDVYNVLKAHTEEDIYLRTDHHWSYLGAFYAVEAFMKQAGVAVPSLSKDYDTISEEGVLGSFYSYYNQTHLAQWPEKFTWYEPKFAYVSEYYNYYTMELKERHNNKMFFFSNKPFYDMVNHGDAYLAHVTTQNQSGRRIAVFKDSFGNALAPFLAKGFDEIWVIDLRYFQGDVYAFLQEHAITDVLLASCLFTNAGGAVSNYTRIFNK